MSKLSIVPIFQKEAFLFIEKFHRHHKKPVGTVFQIGAWDGVTVHKVDYIEKGKKIELDIHLNAVVTIGRPVSRHLDNGETLEVTRLCTDGTRNACSMLYSASWRVAKNLGYTRLITYILKSESGGSLVASGWKLIGERGSDRGWNVPSRPRIDKAPLEMKQLFEIKAA